MKKVLLVLSIFSILFSCKNEIKHKPIEEIPRPEGLNLSLMDTTVRPQDDFYNFVNGNWMKNTEIPSDRGRWGSFDQLREFTDSVSLVLLHKSISKEHEDGSDEQKVANFYATIIDTIARNNTGIDPIKPQLDAIDKINGIVDLQEYLIKRTAYNDNPLYGFYVRPHMKNSNINTLYLGEPNLGMSRDYYLKDDEESKDKLLAYQGYVKNLLAYIGDEHPEISAMENLEFEKELATNLASIEDLRNSELRYNPVSIIELKGIAPAIQWNTYFDAFDIDVDSLIIPELAYYKNLSTLLTEDNIPHIKNYLRVGVIRDNANYLNQELEQMNFNFYSKKLNGIDEMRDRDKRALQTINQTIGQAFGKLYVAAYFPAEAKEKAEEMVRYIRKSYKNHIENLSWMSDSTKLKAKDKLEKFNVKIGYPNEWKDYSDLEIKDPKEGGSFYENMENYAVWRFKENLEKLDEEVDKSEWFMPPQTVNAYYSSSFNEIVFPAAILQPPFYNFKADAAVNFGGMGAVIGHEISHGFDDSGSKYDGDGNLNNWWSKTDEEKFGDLGTALSDQYSSYEPLEEIFVNGKSTLGENIADLGGVNVAYDALMMYLKDKGNPGEIDGFTPEQRFFISWATIWRSKSKVEAMKNQVKTDFHAPGVYRATGPLENVDAFYEAFNITPQDKMYKPEEERIKIW